MGRAHFRESRSEVWVGENRIVFSFGLDTMQRERHIGIARRHCNSEYEVTFIRQGVCCAEVGESRYELTPGQCVLIPPGCYHILRAQPGDFERFCFRFTVEEGPLADALRCRLTVEEVLDIPESMDQLCGMILAIKRPGNPYWYELCSCLLKALLLQMFDRMKLEWLSSRPWQREVDRRVTIDRYIEENMDREPTIEELADLVELSARQLVRVLQEQFGMTFRQKLLRARMDRAAWLLRTSDLPLSRVIDEVGYSSPSAFYQVFRKVFGQTPAQYRNHYRGSVIK